MSNLQEKFVLLQVQHQQDAGSFTKMYELLAEPIYRFIYFKVSDSELAKDLTSEVFIRCWKDLTRPEGKTVKHLRAYVYRIARNIVIDHYRSKFVQVVSIEEDMVDEPATDHLHKEVEIRLDSQRVLEISKRLKTAYQEIILLRYVEDLSLAEISQIMQKSPVATRVLLHRAGQALKREYEKIV